MLFKTVMKTLTANILVQIQIYLYGTCLFSAHVSVLLPTYSWIQAAPGNVSSREHNSKRKILPGTSFFFFLPKSFALRCYYSKEANSKDFIQLRSVTQNSFQRAVLFIF